MTFVSIDFVIFFVIVVSLYFVFPQRWRALLLLGASCYFYAYWNVNYLVLLFFSAGVDFVAAQYIERAQTPFARRAWLLASLVTNLGVLFFFKYFNFAVRSANVALSAVGIEAPPVVLDVLLPVGISFYTFQSMAYTIDVYRRQLAPERNFTRFALYITFFPQLVAGPIERATRLLPQFLHFADFDYDRVVAGLRIMLWGAFIKMVIADYLAVYVNNVYNDIDAYTGIPLWLATVFFGFQIYCDFAGYTYIAIGAAKVLGFNLMENFRQPYLATSVRDFWRRWHISLSTWFRDYVYFPLGGNRVPLPRELVNLMLVFVLSGLWHGAAWTFLIWGVLHGLYIVVETLAQRWRGTQNATLVGHPLLGWLITMTFVMLAWVFFRANSVGDAFYLLQNLFNFTDVSTRAWTVPFHTSSSVGMIQLLVAFALIAGLMAIDYLNARWHVIEQVGSLRIGVRWSIYYAIILLIILSRLTGNTSEAFIYFQF